MTDCPLCARAEATRWERLAGRLLDLIDRPNSAAQVISAHGRLMAAALGSRPLTWYEKHREAWIKTGDDQELVRMQRHVSG